MRDPADMVPCPICRGEGKMYQKCPIPNGELPDCTDCDLCNDFVLCKTCMGNGEVTSNEAREIYNDLKYSK